jgi:hypothetical protein
MARLEAIGYNKRMIQKSTPITLTIPEHIARELPQVSAEINDRMHELLERNTDGTLSALERRELETLVRMAHFGQILSLLASRSSTP